MTEVTLWKNETIIGDSGGDGDDGGADHSDGGDGGSDVGVVRMGGVRQSDASHPGKHQASHAAQHWWPVWPPVLPQISLCQQIVKTLRVNFPY